MKTEKQSSPVGTKTSKLGRRSFVVGAGLTGLGIAGARLGLLDRSQSAGVFRIGAPTVEAAAFTDIDILNFALNLEYLEAEFYTAATTGKTLEQSGFNLSGTGNAGPTLGARSVNFAWDGSSEEASKKLQAIADEIAHDEQQHVLLLRSALGKYAVAKPEINLNALGIGLGSFRQFLDVARIFEDTGVSAYGGAAPLISSKTYLGVAAQIALTEALHAANLRLLVAENYVQSPAFDKYDVPPPPVGTKYFTNNSQGLAVVRTPQEVLSIVYGTKSSGVDKGGFFPVGVNGYFTTT
jgi:hypothetical protein